MCGPVFQSFMEEAIQVYGGTEFAVPPGGYFSKIDRFSGALLPDDATGENVHGGILPRGRRTAIFANAVVDGGFAMGSNLPLFAYGETDGSEGGCRPSRPRPARQG